MKTINDAKAWASLYKLIGEAFESCELIKIMKKETRLFCCQKKIGLLFRKLFWGNVFKKNKYSARNGLSGIR